MTDTERLIKNLKSAEFVYAKTYPTMPHYYTVGKKWANYSEFLWTCHAINKYGKLQYFMTKPRRYFYIDGLQYWIMSDNPDNCKILNRAKQGLFKPKRLLLTTQEVSFDEIKEIPENWNTELATFSDKKTKQVWFKANVNGDVAGCVSIWKLNNKASRLSNLYVIPKYRKYGIAKDLIKATEDWSKDNGFSKVDVRSKHVFWTRLGYNVINQYKSGFGYEKEIL